MRLFGKWLGRLLVFLAVMIAALWSFGPREPVDLAAKFDPGAIGDDPAAYFRSVESVHDDITPGTEKRVIWAGAPGARTPVAIVYLHGFSATSEEIRPVPDRVAKALGANLIYTRLAGHGRPGAALGRARVSDWMADTAEALAVAGQIGDRVVVIATSTGGTLAVAAAADPAVSGELAALVLISPNFGLNTPVAPLLTWPAARHWLPLLAGQERRFEPRSELQARFWTTQYPSVAVFPMAALVKAVAALDFSQITIPALFWYSPDDAVVRADLTTKIAARWGGPATVRHVRMGPGDDIHAHVIAGDALSPGQTDAAVDGIAEWLTGVLD